MNIEKMQAIITQNPEVLGDVRVFKSSEIGRAIRRQKAEPEVVVECYSRSDDWYVREFILDVCGFDIKLAASTGLLSAIGVRNELEEYLQNGPQLFTSVTDFIQFVKNTYKVDLTSNDFETIKREDVNNDLYTFLRVLFYSNARHWPVVKGKKYAEMYRQFFLDSLEYMVKLFVIGERFINNRNMPMAQILNNFPAIAWAIDYPRYKKIVETCGLDSDEEVRIFGRVAYYAFKSSPEYTLSYMADQTQFYDLLLEIKSRLGAEFPFISGNSYGSRERGKAFAVELLRYGYNGALKATDRTLMYELFYKDLLVDKSILNIRENYCSEYFMDSVFSCVPHCKLNEAFDTFVRFYPIGEVYYSLHKVAPLVPDFKVSKEIFETMLSSATMDWDTILIPEELLYDMATIDKLATKLGCDGILFGSQYRGNSYIQNRLQLDKLPEEFFRKYADHINWDNLSCCLNMSNAFVKAHWDHIRFYNVCDKVSQNFDEEIVLHLLSTDENDGYYVARAAKASKMLSAGFIAKHLDKIWRQETWREVAAANSECKLADVVAALE